MVFDFSKLIRKYPIGRSVTILVDGHPEKVTICGYKFSDVTWYVDTKESGIFLLSRLEMLEMKPEGPVELKELREQK